jgi:short-subunit dehydrogenase
VELNGKTALLTGATGGLGRAIARALAERGATLVLSSRKESELAELSSSLPGAGHRTIVADLADEGAAERLVADAGDVDILVANAGLPGSGRLESFSQEEIARAVRVNLQAPIQMTRALLPGLTERGSGHMIYISSLAGKAATARSSVYSATKFGLRGFAIALRQDLAPTAIGVSIVLPGFIRDAGMFADAGAKPPGGLGTSAPEEVGAAVVSAIERNRAEVEVAPLRQRIAAGVAHRSPHLAARLTQGSAAKAGDKLAGGQSDKR